MSTLRLILVLLAAWAAACSSTTAFDRPAQTVVPTAIQLPAATPVPTMARQLQPVATAVELALTEVPEVRVSCETITRTRHTVEAEIDYLNRVVRVWQFIRYVNPTRETLAEVILNIRPNTLTDVFKLDRVTAGQADEATYRLTGQRLTVDLPQPLAAGCAAVIALNYRIFPPAIDPTGIQAYQGYLGYSVRQMNLGHWLATAAAYIDMDWVTRREIAVGEQEVLDEADWDVTLRVTNAPEGLQAAAPGVVLNEDTGTWRFLLEGARDFSLSLSAQYEIAVQQAESGVTVELYTFADARIPTSSGDINSGAFALDMAVKAVETYSRLFGSYPLERLVVVQADFPDGMEFSGLVFVGGEYFRGFGGPTSYLMLITVHEIAHQWWYGLVGSDQAVNPWLDEALATYSEYAFIEEQFPALKDWWWQFRVNSLSPQGFVDSTVYEFESRRAYINAVYLRGVRMLHELRDQLGTESFYAWLRRYAQAGAGRIMTPEAFWSLLTPTQFELTAGVRERYLKHPQIVYINGVDSD